MTTGGDQHCGGVERKHGSCGDSHPDDEQPQSEHRALGQSCSTVRKGREDAQPVGELRDMGDAHQKSQDRPHAEEQGFPLHRVTLVSWNPLESALDTCRGYPVGCGL